MWCALAYLRETLAMILIKCKGKHSRLPFLPWNFCKTFSDQLAILTFTPGKPGSPFSPYIGKKKKVKCKVYNIGYSKQHVSFLIHVKFWTFKIRNYLSLFPLRVAVIRFDLWFNWIKMVEDVFHSSFAHVSNSTRVYALKLLWWSKKQASLPLN